MAVLVAIGVDHDGYRHVLGVREGAKEDQESWRGFLRDLKQRCMVHWYRNMLTVVPKGRAKLVAAMLKAIHAQEDLEAARDKATDVVAKLEGMRLSEAAGIVRDGVEETLTYMQFPTEHWRRIRTNNPMERIMREIRRRTRVVGAFPDGRSALMLVAARLRHIAGTRWGTRKYLDMDRLKEQDQERLFKEAELVTAGS